MHVMALPTCAYTAYGFAVSGKSRIGFNGEFREPVSGLYHLGNGHRTFSPTLMRFLSPDNFSPFRQGGLNTYAYCLGDPINLTDPQGTSPFLKGVAKTLKNIFIPGDIPIEQFSPTRKRLHEQVDTSSQWGQATAAINKALGSNGDGSIPDWKAESYIQRSLDASSSLNPHKRHSLSEPSLFFGSSWEWGQVAVEAFQRGNTEQAGAAAVGIVFNSAGGILVGSTVHSHYKTGRMLLAPADQLTNIRD
ncbi:RHS repeat-associated core domain-containing protein [Pseudomonas putida]|uniref:RHS repeat-associated core domain-containing protein n=1 Tax=Pseudomonas putida TaxID=303 RepID=A0A7Y8D134_PSEPU|nr:RHS repeat-associated core domain-containing protein [Pseudomonas putida]